MAKPKANTKAPAFQFYPKDYLSDAKTRAMTFDQRGKYWDLVCHCWNECGLPEDPIEIARILGIQTPDAAKSFIEGDWPIISRCFYRVEGSSFQHGRLDAERRKQREHRTARSVAGKRGAQARWSHTQKIAKPSSKMAMPSAKNGNAISKNASSSASSSASAFATAVEKKESTSAKLAHEGPRLRIWTWQHEDLARRLGAKAETFDLLLWYVRLEDELDRTGESFADPWKWLQERLYRDAKLPLPNLYGKARHQESGRVGPKPYVHFDKIPEDQWK